MFFAHFQTFFIDFSREITEKDIKLTEEVEKRLKKMFRPAQHPKAGRNTQHSKFQLINENRVEHP